MKKLVFLGTFLLISLGLFIRVSAQTPITINISPEFPKPNEVIYLSIESYSVDLGSSLIRWTVDGRAAGEGIGKRSINTKAGGMGTSLSVNVSITTSGGAIYQDGLIIYPAEVTLLWESDGYTPPFYKGGSPYVLGSRITFVAIPELFKNGKRVNPKSLIYTWKRNGNVVKGASGYGKTTFSTREISYTRIDQAIDVEVSSPTDNYVAQGKISVAPKGPHIVLYEDNPLYGTLFGQAIKNETRLVESEKTLLFVPYFFTLPNGPSSLLTAWSIDGKKITEYNNKDRITLQKLMDSGTSLISVAVRNEDESFQTGQERVNVTIGN